MARSLLKGKDFPNQYWVEEVASAVYLLNFSPTKAIQNVTPYEAWKGTKPTVSHFKIFGCIAYVLVNAQNHQKLDEKSIKCIFVGYCNESKAYKLYNPITSKIIVSRNVIFNEAASWNWSSNNDSKEEHPQLPLLEEENAAPLLEEENAALTPTISPISTPF